MARPRKDTIENPPPAPSPDAVRVQVKQMSGHATEEEMIDSLPENTMTAAPADETPRRKRRTKEEMAAARGQKSVVSDPLLDDRKYQEALRDMQGFGGASIVKGSFDVAALAMKDEKISLQSDEEKRLDGYFYVMSKKYSVLDPTNHWFTMALYFFGMLGSFIFARVAEKKGESLVQQFSRWFGLEEEKESADVESA
jgi:hypothetical protein